MLRPGLHRIGNSLKALRRSLHQVPPLTHDFQNGVPGLLSPAGFDMAWTQYQSLMVEKLNVLTAGGEYESKTPKDILIKYARDPNSAPIFNYASMAHNNHFFFNCLSPNPTAMPDPLKRELEASFSSIDTLRRELTLTASAMFGPGFVWLVRAKDRKYSLLTTYLAGSPYPGAHFRKQTLDMNTTRPDTSSAAATSSSSVADALRRHHASMPHVNQVGAHGPLSEKQISPGGIDLTPVLCLNTWEHVYLADYGVGGKKAFAESWWQAVDWAVVANNADVRGPGAFAKPS